MTNVKIKLIFFVINALLRADFVFTRPQNQSNNTDLPFKISTNSTNEDDFNLPVDSNSDTELRVANDDQTQDQTQEQTNKNSKTEMEAIVTAEQGRDEYILSKKKQKETPKTLDIPKDDALALEKQLNISSSLLEDIIDSETGREETLTDIMFKPESEFVEDVPRFEFLISGRINEINLNTSVNYSDVDKNSSDILKKTDYVELVAIGKNTKIGENKSAYSLENITSHEVDNDLAPDTILSVFSGFTDVQTLLLTCFATLLPLLAVLFAILCIRSLCRRCCPGFCPSCCPKPTSSVDSESSEQKHESDLQHLKSAEESSGLGADAEDAQTSNGSIITMTLKNNHLIVETEERNDITKNGRETKMKYSPDNDGIFVVEVQQAAMYRSNSKSVQNSPPELPQISTNQALIHRVPLSLDEFIIQQENLDDNEDEVMKSICFPGLSISDLSMSSTGSYNASYSYGNQTGYEEGPFGYPIYSGYEIPKEVIGDGILHDNSREPLLCKTPTDPDKPIVTAAIFKQDSIICNDALQGPGYCIEGSSDGPLLSDVQAREVSLQQIHNQMGKKLENGVHIHMEEKTESPKKTFSRADSLPVRLEEETVPGTVIDKTLAMATITEDDVPISAEMLKNKRASLPIIKTEIFGTVKDTILQSNSPKLNRLENEVSDNTTDNPPPMITITEDTECSSQYENGSS